MRDRPERIKQTAEAEEEEEEEGKRGNSECNTSY